MRNVVTEKLLQDGLTPNLAGFDYVRQAILFVIEKPDYLRAVTKELYPDVAKVFETTPSRVDRAMRHAIEKTGSGYTNSEYIAILCEKIKFGLK